ncbi:MAG: hypothetical protein K5857_05110 [Lachnospiraceae bacterium]|nr:hypothetical protein [Lachnospiraceae bacterium]
MNGAVEQYNLKIIEDTPVPLSAGAHDYSGMVMLVVLACIILAIAILYSSWYNGHKKRIAQLLVMGIDNEPYIDGMDCVSAFHPFRTMQIERELEIRAVSNTAKGV